LEQGDLDITNVDKQGNVTGTAFGKKIQNCSFSVSSGEISFLANVGIDTWQNYNGSISILHKGVDKFDYLLGGSYVEVVDGKEMSRYGWYATISKGDVIGNKSPSQKQIDVCVSSRAEGALN
jgi:hypothetical protein